MARNEEALKALAEKLKAQHPEISDADLLKLARARMREENAKQTARKILSAQGAKARKERTRKMIQLGGLLEKAGLETWDSATLLGGLLALKAKEKDSVLLDRFKLQGAEAFKIKGPVEVVPEPVHAPAASAPPQEPAKPIIKAPIAGPSLSDEKKATGGK